MRQVLFKLFEKVIDIFKMNFSLRNLYWNNKNSENITIYNIKHIFQKYTYKCIMIFNLSTEKFIKSKFNVISFLDKQLLKKIKILFSFYKEQMITKNNLSNICFYKKLVCF